MRRLVIPRWPTTYVRADPELTLYVARVKTSDRGFPILIPGDGGHFVADLRNLALYWG